MEGFYFFGGVKWKVSFLCRDLNPWPSNRQKVAIPTALTRILGSITNLFFVCVLSFFFPYLSFVKQKGHVIFGTPRFHWPCRCNRSKHHSHSRSVCLNPDGDIGYLERDLSSYPSNHPLKCRDINSNRPWPLPSTYCPVYRSPAVLPSTHKAFLQRTQTTNALISNEDVNFLSNSEISPTRCNNCVFILRIGFTLHVSGDNLTHHQEYICCIWPQVSRLT